MVVRKIARALGEQSVILAAACQKATGLSNENATFFGLAVFALGLAALLTPVVAAGMALGALVTATTAVAAMRLAKNAPPLARTLDVLALGALVGASLGSGAAGVWRLADSDGPASTAAAGRATGLTSFDKTDEPTLGVRVTHDPKGGVAIAEIFPKSRAERLGIRPGDRIEAINGMPTPSLEEVARRYELALSLSLQRSRATPKLDIERGGRPIELGGVGGDAPPGLGVLCHAGARGAVVDKVFEGSAAELLGVLPGDEITTIDGAPTHDNESVAIAVAGSSGAARVAFLRDGSPQEVRGDLGGLGQGSVPTLGIDFDPRRDMSGVGVTRVEAGSVADKAGLQVGDVVSVVDGHDVWNGSTLQRALALAGPQPVISILRKNERQQLTANLTAVAAVPQTAGTQQAAFQAADSGVVKTLDEALSGH
jgi:S1-C subfamily serine protease